MKYIVFVIMAILGMHVFAAEDPTVEQIIQSQSAGKKIVLVLGATPPESGNLKFPGFDQNPLIIYLNDIHFRDIEHLKSAEASPETTSDWEKQFIQGDFNSLSDLSAIQHRFGAYFDLITLDFSVSKFMDFTGQHLQCFLGMLTIGGAMVFDYSPSCIVLTLKKNGVIQPIESDEEAVNLCFEWLDVAQERLEYKPCVKVRWSHALSSESAQLLRDFYTQYIEGWKTIHMPDTCKLHVIEDSVFPYWQATGHTDRDRWIAELRHYLVMRKLS